MVPEGLGPRLALSNSTARSVYSQLIFLFQQQETVGVPIESCVAAAHTLPWQITVYTALCRTMFTHAARTTAKRSPLDSRHHADRGPMGM